MLLQHSKKSGNGISVNSDGAKTAFDKPVVVREFSYSKYEYLKTGYNLLTPLKIFEVYKSYKKSFDELHDAICAFGPVDSLHSAACYVEAVKRAGSEVKIFELMDDADAIFAGKKERTQEFDDMLNELMVFYEKGYERYLAALKEGYFISDLKL